MKRKREEKREVDWEAEERKGERALRVRYVGDGARCREDGKLFYPARTVSGQTTEGFCSPECAYASMRRYGRA